MVTTQIGGLTSTAVVTDGDGKLVGKAHMATADIANGGKLVIESPPIGDPNFNIVGQAVVAIIKMKQGVAPSLEFVADDKTQTTAQLNGQTGGNGAADPRAAQRALLQQQADAANANALRLAGRQGVVIPGHEGDGPGIKVKFTQEGNQITQVVVTDNIGDITLNADATQIQFKDTVGRVQMTYSEIGKGHAVGKAIGGLSGGAVSGGGAVTLGDKFYTFEVDYPSGKTIKTGTTADTTGGGGMRASTKAGEKAHNREWGARALRAIRAAQAQGADFQPDGDALKALTKFSGDVPEAAIR